MYRFNNFILNMIDTDTLWIPIALIALVGFVFLAAVNRTSFKRILGKIAAVIAKGFHLVVSVFDQVMEALKSASNFIYSIRVMLFKSQNEKVTTHVLHSSIFLLSIASYIATYSSMRLMVNAVIALFLTFSIQATIVAISIKISAKQPPVGHFDWSVFCAERKKHQSNRGIAPDISGKKNEQKQAESQASDREKHWANLKVILNIAVLAYCLFVSIYFSYQYILSQIDASPNTAKAEYYDDVQRFNEISGETANRLNEYEQTDLDNIKNWAAEIKGNRENLVSQYPEIDDLIQQLDNLTSTSSGAASYQQSLETIDITLFKNIIYEIRKSAGDPDDSENQAAENMANWEEEKNRIVKTLFNLKRIHAWRSEKPAFIEHIEIPDIKSKVRAKMKANPSAYRAKLETETYSEELKIIKQTTNDNLSSLPTLLNHGMYDVQSRGLDVLEANFKTLITDITNDIEKTESLTDAASASQKDSRMALLLALGIDLIILSLCLTVGTMQNDTEEQEKAKLMSDAVTLHDSTMRADKQAFVLGVLSLAGFLLVLIINLITDLTWQANFLLGFSLLLLILVVDVICIVCEKCRENKIDTKSNNLAQLTSNLMVNMKEKVSIEIQTLIERLDFNGRHIEQNIEWLASVPYIADDKMYNSDMSKLLALLLAKDLIVIRDGHVWFSRDFFNLLIKNAIYEYGDYEWMEMQLSDAAKQGESTQPPEAEKREEAPHSGDSE